MNFNGTTAPVMSINVCREPFNTINKNQNKKGTVLNNKGETPCNVMETKIALLLKKCHFSWCLL